jgi:site-specific DNA recombinase
MRTAIYVRISQDREGAGLGVARQESDCRDLITRKGWTVAEVYIDNDVSAYSGRPRPAWSRMLDDIRSGAVDALVAWHVDRLTRSPRELEDVIDLADHNSLELATVSGEIDLATPTGRLIARMLGAAARHEAEHKAERQRRERRQAAEAGRVSGGGTRPYGYADDHVSILDEEAEIVRECSRRLLAGESLSSLCRDLFVRGVSTTTGRHWSPTQLRRLLASARISGRREHTPTSSYQGTRPLLGEIVADAVWPGLITIDESDRLRALLSRPERRLGNGTGRRYLLSGILRCGLCGTGMVGRPRSGVPRYVCPNTPGGPGCGGTATNAARTDDHVRDLALYALESPELAGRLRAQESLDPALLAQLSADESKAVELAQAWAEGEITRGEWQAARDVLDDRLARTRHRVARTSRTAPLIDFAGTYDDLAVRWETLPVARRRAIVGAVMEAIEVRPADPRTRWDPDRFLPTWRA